MYVLPHACPVPFAVAPSYPIVQPFSNIGEAYLDALYSTRPATESVLAFARQLYMFCHVQNGADRLSELQNLILPIQLFDHKWRLVVHALLRGEEDVDQRGCLQEQEDNSLRHWAATGAQDGEDPGNRLLNEAVQSLEAHDTRLSCMLLLACTVLLGPEGLKRKKRKRKEPTMSKDPLLLLDYLTDRLQISTLMVNVASSLLAPEQATSKLVKPTDPNQTWWTHCIEPFCAARVPADVYQHHRAKFFPVAPSQAEDSLTAFSVSEPKPRSLLSLEKSARKKDKLAHDPALVSSPTLKSLTNRRSGGETTLREDAFVKPSAPRRVASQGPEQRKLQRGDSLGASSKSKTLFGRRQVVVGGAARRRTTPGVMAAPNAVKAGVNNTQHRKRKSLSPKKLPTVQTEQHDDDVLVPDTPQKPAASRSSRPISQDWRAAVAQDTFLAQPQTLSQDLIDDLPVSTPKSARKWIVPDSD